MVWGSPGDRLSLLKVPRPSWEGQCALEWKLPVPSQGEPEPCQFGESQDHNEVFDVPGSPSPQVTTLLGGGGIHLERSIDGSLSNHSVPQSDSIICVRKVVVPATSRERPSSPYGSSLALRPTHPPGRRGRRWTRVRWQHCLGGLTWVLPEVPVDAEISHAKFFSLATMSYERITPPC